MRGLLERHGASDPICFGATGARSAAQLRAFVQVVAAVLPARAEGQSVVIACRDRYFFMAGLLAGLSRGYRILLPPNGQAEAVLVLARGSQVAALLRDDEGDGIDLRALSKRTVARAREKSVSAAEEAEPAAAQIVLYTSGSTGAPEAHVKSLYQLCSEAETHVHEFELAGRRIVAGVPPQHIYGLLFSVLVPLIGGGSVLRHTPLFPRELCAELVRHAADVMVSVPPQLIALSEDLSVSLPRLHRVFCSAGPLPREPNALLLARGAQVTEILGSTETGGIAFRELPDGPFRPLRGVVTSIDSDSVLHVDAPWLPAEEPRPFRTADRAAPCPEGFRHLGRADAVTKIAGRRVDLGDVEACLRSVASVRDARVLAVDAGGVRGLTLWAVVEGDDVSVDSLREALKGRFDPVTLPKRYRVVAKLPRSDQGKLRRSALLSLFDSWELAFEPLADGAVRVVVPRDYGFVRGHFDGDPILPAVVQLQHIALREIRRRFAELGVLIGVSDVALERAVAPGDALILRLDRETPLSVTFSLEVEAQRSCTGVFHFREAQS